MLSRLRQLPKPERQDLLPAFWRLLVARTALFFGIRRAAGWLSGSKKRETELDLILWQRRALALKRVGGRIPGVACLTRALALRSWMRRQGLPAQMIIGVATAQNTPRYARLGRNKRPTNRRNSHQHPALPGNPATLSKFCQNSRSPLAFRLTPIPPQCYSSPINVTGFN